MKKFMNPEMDIEKFDLLDVITTSECTTHETECDGDICWEDCPDDTYTCPAEIGASIWTPEAENL